MLVKLLHRQVFREHVNLFLLSLASLLGVILLGRMLQLRQILLGQQVGLLDIITLFVFLSPFFLLLLTPIACMLSVFLTFLRMSTDRELVALKASGVSLYQLLPAPLFFCCCCTAFAFFIGLYGMSWGMENFRGKILDMVRTHSRLAVQAGVFNQEFPGLTFYAHQVDEQTGELRFVFVQDQRQKGTTINIVADSGRLATDPHAGTLEVRFDNGRIYRRSGARLDVLAFGTYTIRLPLGSLLGDVRMDERKASELSVPQLRTLLRRPDAFPDVERTEPSKIRTELEKRYALPAGCLALGLFAMPIACMFTGLRQHYGLLVCLGMFMVYYSLFSFGVSLGETGTLSPRVGLWAPNALFALLAALTLRTASRERNLRLMAWLGHRFRRPVAVRRGAA
ncbi:MAG: LPS export ABC transporter permease LptF [Desulfovibrionaceae bacterium]